MVTQVPPKFANQIALLYLCKGFLKFRLDPLEFVGVSRYIAEIISRVDLICANSHI